MLTLEEAEKRITEIEKAWESVKGKGRFAEPSLFNEPDQEQDSGIYEVPGQEPQFQQLGQLKGLMPSRADLPLAVAGFGAASAAGIAQFVSKLIPTLPGGFDPLTISKLLVGWLIYKFGGRFHPLAAAFGGGIVINGIADLAIKFGAYVKPKAASPAPPVGGGMSEPVGNSNPNNSNAETPEQRDRARIDWSRVRA